MVAVGALPFRFKVKLGRFVVSICLLYCMLLKRRKVFLNAKTSHLLMLSLHSNVAGTLPYSL